MNLKIGGNSVGKIMYNGQEFGGTTKLEPGTILYMSTKTEGTIKNMHLLSTAKNWNNINGINVLAYGAKFSKKYANVNISDVKNLDIEKFSLAGETVTVSRSTVDGEYRLNFSSSISSYKYLIKAI